ncbi:MAG TPA: hypothetical protein VN442_21615 [Bryobacteraceae bacterium]|nr:hypothetical protein [Bryobacteraceae bacterium]
MLRLFLIRFILPLIAFLVIRYILKNLLGSSGSSVPAARDGKEDEVHAGGELKRDPVCGTYVAVNSAVTKKVDGREIHFCSVACRDKYSVA